MNASTWLLNAALVALFALAGIAAARRLQRCHPDLAVETTLKRAPYLWVLIPVSLLLLAAAIQSVEWNYARPIAPTLRNDISATGMVTQTSDASCAAAAGATLPRLLGLMKTEREMAELYGTSALLGTTAAQVVYGNATIGIASRKVEIPDRDPDRVAAPAMFFVDHPATGPESHAVAYLGMKEGKAEVWDPTRGFKRLDRKGLASVWRGRGIEFRLASARQNLTTPLEGTGGEVRRNTDGNGRGSTACGLAGPQAPVGTPHQTGL